MLTFVSVFGACTRTRPLLTCGSSPQHVVNSCLQARALWLSFCKVGNFAQPSCHCSMCLAFYRNLQQCRFCFGNDTKHGHTVPNGSNVAVCGLGRTSSYFFRHHAKLRPLYLAKIAHGASEVVARREVMGDEEDPKPSTLNPKPLTLNF